MLQYIDGLNLHISVDNLLLFKKKKKAPNGPHYNKPRLNCSFSVLLKCNLNHIWGKNLKKIQFIYN